MIKIHPLRDADQVEWLRLRRALWPAAAPADLEREMAQIRADMDQQPVFVAEKPDGSLCGMIEVSIRSNAEGCRTDNVGYVEGWFVDPEWRRRGVGRRLVEAAEAWARTQGCTEMASDTDPDYPLSPDAHQGLGYQIVQRTIHFRKDLG
jgi:aminoglycoside 6'-N-acetyltransferase I